MGQIEATRHSLSTIEVDTSFYIKGLKFVCEYKSYPESYNVFDENGIKVAYVHLLDGNITYECFGDVIHYGYVDGYGDEFKSGRQRIKHLTKIANEILERLEDNNERKRND